MPDMPGYKSMVIKGPVFEEIAEYPPDILFIPKDEDGDPMFMVVLKGKDSGRTMALTFCPHGLLGFVTNLVAAMGPTAGKFAKPLWVTKVILESTLNEWPSCTGGDNFHVGGPDADTPPQASN